MVSYSLKSLSKLKRSSFILLLAFIFCIMTLTGFSGAEKVQTNLTIKINPENPEYGQGFQITGLLLTADGKPLGNKRITLETSEKSPDDPDTFAVVITKNTERDGEYEFTRPVDSPPEYIRVKFAGNDNYAPSTSNAIAVRGVGTDKAQIRAKNGSIIVHSTPEKADIYVDDILRGVTPYTVAEIPEGPHILNVTKKGYQNQSMEIYVTSKIDSSFDVSLIK